METKMLLDDEMLHDLFFSILLSTNMIHVHCTYMIVVAALHQNLKHSTWLNHLLGNSASALVLLY